MHVVLGTVIGYALGVFTPGVARKIKAWFVKETTAVKTTVASDVAKKL
jgi:hypothetical protein